MNKLLFIGIVLLLVMAFTGCTLLNVPDNTNGQEDQNGPEPNEDDIPFPDANAGGDEPTRLPF